MALIEYQTSKFSVSSLHSIECSANTKSRERSGNTRQRFGDKCGNRTGAFRMRDSRPRFAARVRLFEYLTVEDAKPYGLGNDFGNPRFSSRRQVSDSGGEPCH